MRQPKVQDCGQGHLFATGRARRTSRLTPRIKPKSGLNWAKNWSNVGLSAEQTLILILLTILLTTRTRPYLIAMESTPPSFLCIFQQPFPASPRFPASKLAPHPQGHQATPWFGEKSVIHTSMIYAIDIRQRSYKSSFRDKKSHFFLVCFTFPASSIPTPPPSPMMSNLSILNVIPGRF